MGMEVCWIQAFHHVPRIRIDWWMRVACPSNTGLTPEKVWGGSVVFQVHNAGFVDLSDLLQAVLLKVSLLRLAGCFFVVWLRSRLRCIPRHCCAGFDGLVSGIVLLGRSSIPLLHARFLKLFFWCALGVVFLGHKRRCLPSRVLRAKATPGFGFPVPGVGTKM